MNAATVEDDPVLTGRALIRLIDASLSACRDAFRNFAAPPPASRRWAVTDLTRSRILALQTQICIEIETRLEGAVVDAVAALVPAASGRTPGLRSDMPPVRDALLGAKLLTDAALIETAMLTVAEQRISMADVPARPDDFIDRSPRARETIVDAWIREADRPIANALTRYLVERTARRDPYGNMIFLLADLEPDTAEPLVWTAAAIWRADIRKALDLSEAAADGVLETAARNLVAEIDRERLARSSAENAASAIINGALITPESLTDLLFAGETALFLAVLAELTGLPRSGVRRLALEPAGLGLAVLYRAADLGTDDYLTASARMSGAWSVLRQAIAQPAGATDIDPRRVFAETDDAAIRNVVRVMARDSRFAAALARLS